MNNQLEQTIAKIEALPTDSGLFPFEWIKHFGKEGWSAIDGQQIIPSAEIKAIAAEVKRLNYILETIRNMSVYIHEKDPNPDPQFMADFYKTKLGDAVDHARKELEGE